MRRTTISGFTLISLTLSGCSDRPAAPIADPHAAYVASLRSPTGAPQRLARSIARALRSPVVRAELKAQLEASPFREHKLQFQHHLRGPGLRLLHAMAGDSKRAPDDVEQDADSTIPLELYMPVAKHRATWTGDGRILVATALGDHEAPVAFDTAGNRYVLNSNTPPVIPVLALVPVETDFTAAPSLKMCMSDCPASGGSGNGDPPPTPGLYMTHAHFTQTFEGWLKGAPEFEVHVLGQLGQTDSMTDYQCAGEKQLAPYNFDQNDLDWSGNVLLFSATQLAAYKTQHPGQNVRVYAIEDDDTACKIKTDAFQFSSALMSVDQANHSLTAGKDSSNFWKFAQALLQIVSTTASIINTNDELVGNAVKDSIANEYHNGFNWIVKGGNNLTNGWITLEMK